MSYLLDFNSLDVNLGGRPVLREIDLRLGEGEAIAIVGPNGSGKTTLLRLAATLIRPGSGTGSVLGASLVAPIPREVRSQIGLISHLPGLIDQLTIYENLAHFCRLSGRSESRCRPALETVGLERVPDRRVSESSFGMKRRAEIAWLLIARPRILLLDEARSGLDDEARRLVDALIQRTLESGGATIGVSHESEALTLGSTTVLHLAEGRLERTG